MQTHPLRNEKWRVFIRVDEFEQLLESAEHQRGRTAITVMGNSLRVGTAATVLMGQFYQDKEGHWWLHVDAKDATDRDRETKPREVPFTDKLIKVLEKHKNVTDISTLPDDEPLFDVVKRTLQRDVKDAAENAAIATGNDEFEKISSHDLRRYYASHYLFRLKVDQHTVRQIGGWKKVEHMFEYLLLPRDLIKDRLAAQGLLGSNPLTSTRSGPVDQIHSNFDTLEHLSRQSDSTDVQQSIQDRLVTLADHTDGVTVALDNPRGSSNESTDASTIQTDQATMRGFNSESGTVAPETILTAAYMVSLITVSWALTLAPIA